MSVEIGLKLSLTLLFFYCEKLTANPLNVSKGFAIPWNNSCVLQNVQGPKFNEEYSALCGNPSAVDSFCALVVNSTDKLCRLSIIDIANDTSNLNNLTVQELCKNLLPELNGEQCAKICSSAQLQNGGNDNYSGVRYLCRYLVSIKKSITNPDISKENSSNPVNDSPNMRTVDKPAMANNTENQKDIRQKEEKTSLGGATVATQKQTVKNVEDKTTANNKNPSGGSTSAGDGGSSSVTIPVTTAPTQMPKTSLSSSLDADDEGENEEDVSPVGQPPGKPANLDDEDLGDEGDPDDTKDEFGEGPNNKEEMTQLKDKATFDTTNFDYNDGDSHFFVYFLTIVVICVILYIVFHNKNKIIALIIEGRSERRKRPNLSQYRKLDNKLEEDKSSNNIIY